MNSAVWGWIGVSAAVIFLVDAGLHWVRGDLVLAVYRRTKIGAAWTSGTVRRVAWLWLALGLYLLATSISEIV